MKDFISNGKGRRILKPKEASVKLFAADHTEFQNCNSVCRRQFARLTASSPFPQAKLRAEGRRPLSKYYVSNLLEVVAH
jgi:hypothetical protein